MTLLRGLGFLVVMAYVLRKIPTPEIGLWYIMLSIAGLGAIVELGFATTISRYASYYSGGAVDIPALGTSQRGAGAMNTRAIAALVHMARRLYLLFGVLVGVLMLVFWAGWRFWSATPAQDVGPRQPAAFFLLVLGTAFNMSGMYWQALQYGMNRVRPFYQWMVAGLVANYAVALIGLAAGAGILALVVGQIVGTMVPRLGARQFVRGELKRLEPGGEMTMSWRVLWPTVPARAGLGSSSRAGVVL